MTTVDPPTAASDPPNGGRVLDDDAAALLAEWLALTPVPVHEQPLAQSRNSGLVNAEITGPSPVVPSVEDRDVGGVRVRIYRPDVGAAPPVLVYAHGGGWTLLSIDSSDVICRHLAAGAGCAVVSVDYRLAPEHPFPAAFDDVWAVATWVDGGGLGWVPPSLAIGGDSAGGNIAAGVSTHARDHGGLRVDFQLLLYPALDTSLDTPSMLELGPDLRFRLMPETMRWFWRNYLGESGTSDDPRAVPMAARSKAGLPSTLVVTAGWDPLRDDGARYAEALAAAGTPVEVYEASALPHGFAMMLGRSGAARRAFADVVARVAAALGPATDPPAAPPTELAAEFKARPFGRHSEELQSLLHEMRSQPMSGKHFLFMAEAQRLWVLGRYSDGPPYEPILDWDTTFTDLEAAEWHVFRIRWQEKFGVELAL